MSDTEAVSLVPDATVGRLVTAVTLAALTAVLAQVSIQLPGGIPFSLQPFGVFFAGLLLGPAWGGFALLVYLLVGVAGAPVFSNAGAGLGYLLGPTGGFLLGFLLGAVLLGVIVHRSLEPRRLDTRSTPLLVLGLLGALLGTYAIGVPWFATVQGWTLVQAGVFMAPFLLGDLIKAAIALAVVRRHGDRLARFQ